MRRLILPLLAMSALAACAQRSAASGAATSPTAAVAACDSPALDRYTLAGSELLPTGPRDSIYRFRDSSTAFVSLIRYAVTPDVRFDADSQAWTLREGDKFPQVQQLLLEAGRQDDNRLLVADSSRLDVGGRSINESMYAMAVMRMRVPTVEVQYLYLIGDRFLKVRGSFQSDQWGRSDFAEWTRASARCAWSGVTPG